MLLVGTNPYNKEMNVFFDTLKQELKSKFCDKDSSSGPDIEGIMRLKQLQESRRKGVK